MLTLLIIFCSREATVLQTEYDKVIKINIELQNELDKLQDERKQNYQFPYGIPSIIKPLPEGVSNASPYKIDYPNDDNLIINGVIELLCKIYHISKKTDADEYKEDNTVTDKIMYAPHISLTYGFPSKNKIPLYQKVIEVHELILWYDLTQDVVMMTFLKDESYYSYSLKGSYFEKRDVLKIIYDFISTYNRDPR
jgi:hypothetical protein